MVFYPGTYKLFPSLIWTPQGWYEECCYGWTGIPSWYNYWMAFYAVTQWRLIWRYGCTTSAPECA